MEATLTNYIRALRAAGAMVSPAEAIDAARTLGVIGYADRTTLKDSLSLTLAKTVEEKRLHDQLFDLYFHRHHHEPPPDPTPPAAQGGSPDGEGASGSDALVELANAGGERLAAALERAANEAEVDDIRFASQASFFTRRMLETLGVEDLEKRLLQAFDEKGPEARARAQALMDARAALAREARALVDQRFEVFGRAATETFMNSVVLNRPIDQLALRDLERMKVIVARMARRLAVKHSRHRKVKDRGRLDLRHTLRANAGHDFVPFDLVWRQRKRDRPKIMALCDVSGSVAPYVRFLMMFLYALNATVADMGAFAFSAELRDVSWPLSRMDFEAALEHVVMELATGGTDYGQALVDLTDHHLEDIDRRTTVIVLGDGRSNYADPRLDLFAEIANRAKRVVWLCPEPPGRWGSGDSVLLDYQPHCTHLTHCATALDLEHALDEILLAYD